MQRRIRDRKRTLQAELGVVEAKGGRVGGRQQRPPAFLDVERHGGRHQVGYGPLRRRHDVQRPHAPLHRDAHQHLARRPPPGLAATAATTRRGDGAEASPPHAGEQVRQRLGPLLLLQLVPLLRRPAAVERRRPLPGHRRRRLLALPATGAALVAVRRRRQRRHRAGRRDSCERRRGDRSVVTSGRVTVGGGRTRGGRTTTGPMRRRTCRGPRRLRSPCRSGGAFRVPSVRRDQACLRRAGGIGRAILQQGWGRLLLSVASGGRGRDGCGAPETGGAVLGAATAVPRAIDSKQEMRMQGRSGGVQVSNAIDSTGMIVLIGGGGKERVGTWEDARPGQADSDAGRGRGGARYWGRAGAALPA
ncbi:hypothetical protein SETIT_7G087300v2 [Setaria italica]|uniref:Uncharacterized protein n=1 Tax=Setaria italica TaxID=4555 RepID=A0A368RTN9_SETIT|nr:hypothetical protein SETIT_7G087300v2 [Setaria italica]